MFRDCSDHAGSVVFKPKFYLLFSPSFVDFLDGKEERIITAFLQIIAALLLVWFDSSQQYLYCDVPFDLLQKIISYEMHFLGILWSLQ